MLLCTLTRRTPEIVGCAKSGDSTKKPFYISTVFNGFIVMTQENILFIQVKLVLDSKLFGKGDGFPDSAETPSQRDFCVIVYYDYHQAKPFKQCFQSLSNCFGDHSPL